MFQQLSDRLVGQDGILRAVVNRAIGRRLPFGAQVGNLPHTP
jgi:hypothetical protein